MYNLTHGFIGVKEKALNEESLHVSKYEELFHNVRGVTGHKDLEKVVIEFTTKDEENFARFLSVNNNLAYGKTPLVGISTKTTRIIMPLSSLTPRPNQLEVRGSGGNAPQSPPLLRSESGLE